MPVAGARCASGRAAPVSSILISFDCALTLVARLLRPFLVDRPVNSSFSAPEFTRTVKVLSAPSPAEGSSAISTSTSPAPRATAPYVSTEASDAAGRAARAAAAEPLEPPSSPTRTTQHRFPPFWKNP